MSHSGVRARQGLGPAAGPCSRLITTLMRKGRVLMAISRAPMLLIWLIKVNCGSYSATRRHAIEAQPVLRGKAKVEANEGEGQMQPAQVFIEHAATEFGEPVINRGKDHEHRAAVDDVVEVANNEIGVMDMHVEGHLS